MPKSVRHYLSKKHYMSKRRKTMRKGGSGFLTGTLPKTFKYLDSKMRPKPNVTKKSNIIPLGTYEEGISSPLLHPEQYYKIQQNGIKKFGKKITGFFQKDLPKALGASDIQSRSDYFPDNCSVASLNIYIDKLDRIKSSYDEYENKYNELVKKVDSLKITKDRRGNFLQERLIGPPPKPTVSTGEPEVNELTGENEVNDLHGVNGNPGENVTL